MLLKQVTKNTKYKVDYTNFDFVFRFRRLEAFM